MPVPPPDIPVDALRVSIIGAESSGKSELARALAVRLEDEFGLRCLCVAEFLREWCDSQGRTPRPEEQRSIAEEQQARIATAAAREDVDVVLCDTTPIMTDVYSDLLFDDRSLEPFARESQRTMDATLLTALDLPWVADGLQRDGPHVRGPVDALVRGRLIRWGVSWSLVAGRGEERTDCAVDALRSLLRRRAAHEAAGSGLFTRLASTHAGPPRPTWRCERCDDPTCEHLAQRATR